MKGIVFRRLIIMLAMTVSILSIPVPVLADDVNVLAGELIRMNDKIDAKVKYYGVSEYPRIFTETIQENPNILIREYPIIGEYNGAASILLVCNKEKSRGLLLDISCTPELDWNLSQKGNYPCEIMPEARQVCTK